MNQGVIERVVAMESRKEWGGDDVTGGGNAKWRNSASYFVLVNYMA